PGFSRPTKHASSRTGRRDLAVTCTSRLSIWPTSTGPRGASSTTARRIQSPRRGAMPKDRKLERRFLAVRAFEAREKEESKTLRGYALTWGEVAEPWPGLRESFEAGAFADFLAQAPDVFACYQHDTSQLLGRTSSGTFRLAEDETGLAFELDLPDTTLGRDVAELVRRGDLRGMSIAFCVERETLEDEGDHIRRVVHAASLYEISIVHDPAYRETSVGFRSAHDVMMELRSRTRAAQDARRRCARARLRLLGM